MSNAISTPGEMSPRQQAVKTLEVRRAQLKRAERNKVWAKKTFDKALDQLIACNREISYLEAQVYFTGKEASNE